MVYAICLLKDNRLVSGCSNGKIVVYDHSYEPQIQINSEDLIYSLCVLRNGDLVSASSSSYGDS